jgi:hypothetical protein
MPNQPNEWIKQALKKLRKRYHDQCYFCQSTKDLEFAHITETNLSGRGRGRKERYYDVIKNPNSYLLLCKECHTKMDNGGTKENEAKGT